MNLFSCKPAARGTEVLGGELNYLRLHLWAFKEELFQHRFAPIAVAARNQTCLVRFLLAGHHETTSAQRFLGTCANYSSALDVVAEEFGLGHHKKQTKAASSGSLIEQTGNRIQVFSSIAGCGKVKTNNVK